jgi:hypothetical protein
MWRGTTIITRDHHTIVTTKAAPWPPGENFSSEDIVASNLLRNSLSYGLPDESGHGTPIWCSSHRRPGCLYLKPSAATCTAPSAACATDHIPKGLVHVPNTSVDEANVVHRGGHPHCKAQGCTKNPSYGFSGCEPEFCFTHKTPTMVNLHPGAASTASSACGRQGQGRNHVPKGLTHIPNTHADDEKKVVHTGSHPHCKAQGCAKNPSYDFSGCEPEYCYTHKTPTMVNLHHGPTLSSTPQQRGADSGAKENAHSDPPAEVSGKLLRAV